MSGFQGLDHWFLQRNSEGTNVARTLAKIDSFDLPDFVEGAARRLAQFGALVGLETGAFSGYDGSVVIAFYSQDVALEVLLESDGGASFVVKKGVGYPAVELDASDEATFQLLRPWFNRMAAAEWNSFGSFGLIGGMTSSSVSFPHTPSGGVQAGTLPLQTASTESRLLRSAAS